VFAGVGLAGRLGVQEKSTAPRARLTYIHLLTSLCFGIGRIKESNSRTATRKEKFASHSTFFSQRALHAR
jgi:hypothetical protein